MPANVRKSEGNINPPPTPPTSRPTIESRLDSISNGIKSINEEPIFDILNWTELGLIVSLLMGLFGIIYSGFQVSLLKEKISKSEERPANTSGNSFDLARNPNQRIDNIESKFNKHVEGLLNLQNRMNQLEREPPRTNNANTFQNPQTSVQQFSLHLPPFFISCRGGVEGTLLNVSPNSDNNSIFQINSNGFCINNSPDYGNSSFLVYNNG